MAHWRRVLTSVPAIVAAGVIVLYLLAGYFLVGPLARWVLPRYAVDSLGSRASVAEVRFDPLHLALSIKNLRLAQPDGAPLAGIRSLYARLEWSSLLRFAWHLSDLDVRGLNVRLAVAKDGHFNWDELLAALARRKSQPSNNIPRLLVSRLRLSDGNIEYENASGARPYATRIGPIDLQLNDLSTLPRDTGGYILSARLPGQGATLKWAGRIGLNPVFSEGRAALENLDLARAARAVKLPGAWTVQRGTLSLSTDYRLQVPVVGFALQIAALKLDLTGLGVALGDGAQMGLAHAQITGGAYDTNSGRTGWQALDLAGLSLVQGRQALLRLGKLRAVGLDVNTHARRVRLDALSLAGGEVDAGIDGAGRLNWAQLPAASAAPAGAPRARAGKPWALAVKSVEISGMDGSFTDQRLVQPLQVVMQGFRLNASVAGELGGDKPGWRLQDIAAGLGPVRLQSGFDAVASIVGVSLAHGNVDLSRREISAASLVIDGPATRVVREKSGTLNWQAFLAQRRIPAAASPQRSAERTANGLPWRYSLGQLEVRGADIAVEDATPPEPMRLNLTGGQLVLRNLSQDLARPVPASLALTVGGRGRLVADGNIVPAQARAVAQVRLTALPLYPFAPYVNQYARLTLKSGSASASGRLAFAAHGRPMLDYRGGFAVDHLAIAEEESGDPFLGWQSLRGRGLDLALGPGRLHLRELVADRPFGKVIINPDKSLNLRNVLRRQTAAQPPTAQAAVPSGKPAPQETEFPIRIRQIMVRRGDLQFADLSLKPQFGARIEDLDGAISGLSSRPDASAQVELDGRVGQYGSAQVRGRLQPFAATDHTDLTLKFRNLEMNPLSPYSGKFAGRLIDSGRLSVDLQYKIQHRELAGENRFVISKLKLGPPVDSPDAVKLPLDLAIALLEDSQGIIDVDIPISGNLDDPKFSYGHLIWQAVLNLLTKVVTSPFRALGALLGIDSEKFGTVDFRYGDARLAPPEVEKLGQIAQALGKRPSLQLAVAPTFDPQRDTAALQELTLRQKVARHLRVTVPAGTQPPPVDVHDRVTRLILEDLYDQTFSGGISALRAEIKPKDIEQLYQEAVRRLEKRIDIAPNQLENLGRARALAVVTQLEKIPGLPAGRIVLGRSYARVESQAPELAIKLELQPARMPVASPAAQASGAQAVP